MTPGSEAVQAQENKFIYGWLFSFGAESRANGMVKYTRQMESNSTVWVRKA
jgi:hypothetical protein